MSDTLFIHALAVEAIIGLNPQERRVPQPLLIDIEMETDAAAAKEDLEASVDYGAVAREARAFVEASAYRLIETLADALAGHLVRTFDLPRIDLTVTKPNAVPGARVGIRISRAAPGR